MLHAAAFICSALTPFISAIFAVISGILAGVLGNVPYFEAGDIYGLSVSVSSRFKGSAAIDFLERLLPFHVEVPPNEKLIPSFSNLNASSGECE